MTKGKRHSWTESEFTRGRNINHFYFCRKCGLRRVSSGYDLERTYYWDGPPKLRWRELAPTCPPDLATGTALRTIAAGPQTGSA
jgi:hypothetical protein